MAASILWVAVPMWLNPDQTPVSGFRIVGIRLTPTTAPVAIGFAAILSAYSALCFYASGATVSGAWAREFTELERLTAPDAPGLVRVERASRTHLRKWPLSSTLSGVDRDEILRVLRAFDLAGLRYVLIGATAMGFHGLVRATEDIDLFIEATAENVERLRVALRAAYDHDPHIEEISAADLLGEYPALRYYPPSGDLYFDVMTRLDDAASFETVDAEIKDIADIHVSVATPAALYRLKKDTVRAKDREDAAALRETFQLKDEA